MERKTLQIYFTSDLHGYMYPTDYRSAKERDVGLFKCANRFHKDGDTLIIDGGDALQGSPFGAYCHDTLDSPRAFAEILNACGYDFVTLGNHDFNFGTAYLNAYLEALNARCVCQNLTGPDGAERYPWQVRTIENGLRVGVVGIVTDHVNIWEKPEHLDGVKISDPFPAARAALEAMRGQCDLTVCVYHGGFERDLETGRVLTQSTENIAYRICQELDFDLLLTGHQHMSVPGRMLFGTYVVQPADCGREFHQIQVVLEGNKRTVTSRLIPAGGACGQPLLDSFAEIEAGTQGWLDDVAGRLPRPLLPAPPLLMAAEGSEIADLFNQVQLRYSGAQLSAVSLANEIAGFPQTVRRRDVLTTYPYTNSLVVLEITGDILRRSIERSAEYFDLDAERRLVVSERFLKPKVEHYNYDYYAGVHYVIDVTRPLGQRVTELTYQGRPVEDGDVFTICLSDYRASGTGGYPAYQGCPVVQQLNTEMTYLIMSYFKDASPTVLPERADYKIIC